MTTCICKWRRGSYPSDIDDNVRIPNPDCEAHSHTELDALRAERDELDATVRLLSKVQTNLIAELAAAKKDAERLDWIEKNLADFTYWKENQIWNGIKRYPIEVDWGRDNLVVGGDTLRAAIDAAMKEPT